jgi:hypothetical protein
VRNIESKERRGERRAFISCAVAASRSVYKGDGDNSYCSRVPDCNPLLGGLEPLYFDTK